MCGIAGYVGRNAVDEPRVTAALDLMGRRGPHNRAWKHWEDPGGRHVYLLHSRLDIIDLDDRSNQPFNAGHSWLSFNGELYNYLELRRELEPEHRFTTTSDTEVLAAALDTRGWGVLDRCEGMWAFALYSERDGSVTLSRDRFGEKPLYLFQDDDGLYFGSEVKFIGALLGRKLPINFDHVYRHLINGYKALYKRPHTFFAGLSELPPATTLKVGTDGQLKQASYWQPRFAQDADMTYQAAIEGTRQRLIRSVELRLRADVPLAFCMSGGVDSNALIAIAKRELGYDVHGFTIQNTDSRYEEQDMVEHVVAELGLRHTSVPLTTASFLPRLRELIRQHDAPVYTITYYVQWLLLGEIAARGYRISVSGTAADELFSGYYDHHLAYLYDVRRDAQRRAAALKAWQTHVKPIVRNPYLGNPNLFLHAPDMRDYIFLDSQLFSDYLTAGWNEPFEEEEFTGDLLRNRMANELLHETVPVILHEDDLNAMYYSIENRSPFLDRELFEFAASVPTEHLIRDGMAKAVLRDAMRGIVPDRVLDCRRKVGFNAPIHDLLDTSDPAVRDELLADSAIFEHVRRDKIAALIEQTELPNSRSKLLFNFVNAKLFLEEFG